MIYVLCSYVREREVTSNYITLPGRTVTTENLGVTESVVDVAKWDRFSLVTRLHSTVQLTVSLMRCIHVVAELFSPSHSERRRATQSKLGSMPNRNPFTYDKDKNHAEDSEFGFGRGMFPDPRIDFSDGGSKSMIPIADPTSDDQLLTLAMIKRMDLSDPNDQPSPYVAGNTDRFGAAPPLVRERRLPKYCRPKQDPPPRMRRAE